MYQRNRFLILYLDGVRSSHARTGEVRRDSHETQTSRPQRSNATPGWRGPSAGKMPLGRVPQATDARQPPRPTQAETVVVVARSPRGRTCPRATLCAITSHNAPCPLPAITPPGLSADAAARAPQRPHKCTRACGHLLNRAQRLSTQVPLSHLAPEAGCSRVQIADRGSGRAAKGGSEDRCYNQYNLEGGGSTARVLRCALTKSAPPPLGLEPLPATTRG